MTKRSDQRSDDAQSYRRWYNTRQWRKISTAQRQREPLCAICLAMGLTTLCEVCDHITPHRGDAELFWHGPFQSLCRPCHDATKQQIEVRGFHDLTDRLGFPIDVNHPANRPRKQAK